jgi:methyl-accepting chemotaxis protein
MFRFIANRRIGSKIAAGYAVVLLIFAVSTALTWRAFERTDVAIRASGRLAEHAAIYPDIRFTLANYRAHVREFTFSNAADTAKAAVAEGQALHKLVATGIREAKSPQRLKLLEDLARQEEAYDAGFAQLQDLTSKQEKLQSDVLEPLGEKLTLGFTMLGNAATAANNAELATLAADGRRQSLVARLDVTKRLSNHDQMAAASVSQDFSSLRLVVTRLDMGTQANADLNANVKDLAKEIDAYQNAYRQAVALDTERLALVNGPMLQASDAMVAAATKALESSQADQAQMRAAVVAETAGGVAQVLWLGLAGLVVSIGLAWVVGRGIAQPVVRMCAAMRTLADGDKTVAIPGLGRHDEVGQMAGTVQVFKDNMLEADRLRAEQERTKAAAEAERRQGMLRLADEFETGIKGVVNAVATQAGQMQSAAQAMSATAQAATQQATSVAAAVEQASASVQTVASSAEELSSSVREIGQQMERSSKIAGQAVAEAEQTNATVEGLNKTAQRIGEVVQLIETIASQTNLLALNATIEAARAGDAGKGFAVVASEVKSLANQTAKATSDIKTQIDEIQGATQQTVQAIRSIGGTIRQMSEISTAIASAVEEQGAATQEIAGSVQQAAQGTAEIATNIGGVSRAANETGAAAAQVLAGAGELSAQSEKLRRDVDTFLTTVRAA